MKVNKLFAIALTALTLVGFNACKNKNTAEALKLDPTSLSLKVGETATITATVAATWTSSADAIVTVAPGNDGGKTALVTAVAEGNAIISATANGETKTCVVVVNKGGDGPTPSGQGVKGSKIWPIVLDAVTAEKNAALIAGDFRVNDVENFLYIWPGGESYVAGDGAGKNFFGNTEGYVSLTVAQWNEAWSGGGFCVNNADAITAMLALKAGIVANPDKYFLHIGIKATNAGNHEFYTFGTDATAFNIGKAAIEKGAVIGDFERDGEWHEFDVPMAQFASAVANADVKAGINILCFLSGAQIGAQLNLDAVYFYEK